MKRLLFTVGIVAAGVLTAMLLRLEGIAHSTAFFVAASALLAVGLFSSTTAIPLKELAPHWRLVLVAVTVGVLAKAAIISAVMYAAFREPAYIVLGAAMAQIDPLSVAALQRSSRLSARGRAILLAWSSFDDPVTTVLVILLAGFAVRATGAPAPSGAAADLTAVPLSTVLGNVLLLAAAGLLWAVLRRVPGRPVGDDPPSRLWQAAAVAALVVVAAVAVAEFLMLALAVAGLFFRPRIERLLSRATGVAFVVAAFLLGLVLAGGADIVQGAALGVAAYLAQVVVGLVIARRLPGDRVRLALSQQSGITAILLAILLEAALPGTVGVVAPAILVVNVLHWATNTWLDRRDDRRDRAAAVTGTQSP